MENIIKQLKNGAKHTRLSTVEKAAIKSQLLHYAKTHPTHLAANSSRTISSPFNISNFRNKKSISILVIGGLLTFGSVSLAAENTVPGDVFYPIKIHINEQVRGAIAVTPKAKAEWDVRKAERRLEEVEKLAVAPSVSREIKNAAEENFNASANKVEERIVNFEKENDNEDAIRTAGKLAEMLRKHEGAFDKKSNDKKVSVRDASFVEIAATTTSTTEESILSAREAKSDSLDNVLENIRVVRVKAEKKQKELKSKYKKDFDRKDDFSDDGTLGAQDATSTSTFTQEEIPDENYNNSFDKRSRGHKEEIRITPNKAPKTNEDD